jgi:hypothetical protein
MDKKLINLLKSLKEPEFVPSKSALNLGSKLLERLFLWDLPSDDGNENNTENCKNEEVGQEPLSMADELSMLFKQAEKPHKESNDFSRTKQEFALFQKTGKRTEN